MKSMSKFLRLCCFIGIAVVMVSSQNIDYRSINMVRTQRNRQNDVTYGLVTADAFQSGQQEGAGDGAYNDDDDEGDDDEETGDNDAMARLANVETVDEFLTLLQTPGGDQVTPADIFSEHRSEDGKRVIYSGGRMAEPDECSPRNTTVQLTMNNTESNEIFFPRCTRVERCGGCCPSPHLRCVSMYTERLRLSVVKAQALRPGSNHLVFSGIGHVIVDRHVRCQLRCTLTEDSCGPRKIFLHNQCTCKCRRYERCPAPKVFDSETCECQCPHVYNCCNGGSTACGMVFNSRNCQCQVNDGREHMNSRDSSSSSNATRPGSGDDHRDDRVYISNISTTRAPSNDPCFFVNCPRTFRRVLVNGECRCRPIGRFRRPRPRSRLRRVRPGN